jgi:hypothetical protein
MVGMYCSIPSIAPAQLADECPRKSIPQILTLVDYYCRLAYNNSVLRSGLLSFWIIWINWNELDKNWIMNILLQWLDI